MSWRLGNSATFCSRSCVSTPSALTVCDPWLWTRCWVSRLFDGKYPVDNGRGRQSPDCCRSKGAAHWLGPVWALAAVLGGSRGSVTLISSSRAAVVAAAASRSASCSLTIPLRRDAANEFDRSGVGDGGFCAWCVLLRSWLEQRDSGAADLVDVVIVVFTPVLPPGEHNENAA